MLKLIVWDFDGVIADTLGPGIEIWNRIAGSSHPAEITVSDVRKLGIEKFVMKLNIPFYKIPFYIGKVKEDLGPEMEKVKVFPGMVQVLQELKQKYRLGIVTTNSRKNVELFLNANKMTEFFDFVVADVGIFGKSKNIEMAAVEDGVEKNETLCIGDEVRDVQAAKKADVRIVSVSWGFNSPELLEQAGAERIVSTPEELLEAIDLINQGVKTPDKSLL